MATSVFYSRCKTVLSAVSGAATISTKINVFCVYYHQTRRKPQRGPAKHSRGAALEKKMFGFFFSKWCSLVYYCIAERRRALKRHGARGSLPPYPTLSTGLIIIVLHCKDFIPLKHQKT